MYNQISNLTNHVKKHNSHSACAHTYLYNTHTTRATYTYTNTYLLHTHTPYTLHVHTTHTAHL